MSFVEQQGLQGCCEGIVTLNFSWEVARLPLLNITKRSGPTSQLEGPCADWWCTTATFVVWANVAARFFLPWGCGRLSNRLSRSSINRLLAISCLCRRSSDSPRPSRSCARHMAQVFFFQWLRVARHLTIDLQTRHSCWILSDLMV